jgi:hypothetical protein
VFLLGVALSSSEATERLVRCTGQKHLVSGSASAVAVAISAPFLRFKSVSFPAHVSDVVEMHEWFVAGRPLGPCT